MATQEAQGPIQVKVWQDVSKTIAKINPEFARLVDEIAPDDAFRLYEVTYRYGDLIEASGFYLPTEFGTTESIKDAKLTQQMREDLHYAGTSIPSGMLLEGGLEVFLQPVEERVLPTQTFVPGQVFATWRKLASSQKGFHPMSFMRVAAGARSAFMLPNVGDHALHRHLQRDYNITQNAPKGLLAQWEVFKAIARSATAACDWHVKVLFFSGAWINAINSDDPAWLKFRYHILKQNWEGSDYWRNQRHIDFAVSYAQKIKNLRPNPYLLDTFKHILTISAGASNGFSPQVDETFLPCKVLQKAYVEAYRLREYAPILMAPSYFNLAKNTVVYYSLQHPTTLEFSPVTRQNVSTLQELLELKHIANAIFTSFMVDKVGVAGTRFEDMTQELALHFYHNNLDAQGEIEPTILISERDANMRLAAGGYSDRVFPESGTFLRGVLSLSKKTGDSEN